ncbi:MAG: D-glycero-beta-D-manno-heptose 1-phosphate adenylyltransferase [bacterium]
MLRQSPMGKILSFADLPAWRQSQKDCIIVATNGCFDILHTGHLRYLQAARQLGDGLIVGVNSDESVRALKGPNRPLNPEADRAEMLAGLSVVDWVVVFSETRAVNFLNAVKPHIYVKGGDYTTAQLDQDEVAAVTRNGGQIRILPLVPGRSTTGLIERLQSK